MSAESTKEATAEGHKVTTVVEGTDATAAAPDVASPPESVAKIDVLSQKQPTFLGQVPLVRILTALNHQGNRKAVGYTGPDTFLTRKGDGLVLMAKNDSPEQKWFFTGDGALYNGTGKYLTAYVADGGGKALKFAERNYDDAGQTWVAGWHPTSELFQNHSLNVYGGRNGEGNQVGLYFNENGSNEEWRVETNDGPLELPEIRRIDFDTEGWKPTGDPKEVEIAESSEFENKGDEPIDASFTWKKTVVEETTSDAHFSFNESIKNSASAKASAKAPGDLASAEVSVGTEVQFSASQAFGWSNKAGTSEEKTQEYKFKVPPRQKVVCKMTGYRLDARIPYTVTYDGGAKVTYFINHKKCFKTKFSLVPLHFYTKEEVEATLEK